MSTSTPRMPGGMSGPDLTDRIMTRLGYRRLDAAAARRRAVRRWMGRLVMACVLVAGAAFAWQTHQSSDRARRPSGPTLEQAVESSAKEREETLRAWVRTVRMVRDRIGVQESDMEPAASDPPADGNALIAPWWEGSQPSRSNVPWSGLL